MPKNLIVLGLNIITPKDRVKNIYG